MVAEPEKAPEEDANADDELTVDEAHSPGDEQTDKAEEDTDEAEEEAEPDPLAALQQTVTQHSTAIGRIDGVEQRVRSELGQLGTIQSDIAALQDRDPNAAIDPRITVLEGTLAAVLDIQIASEVDETRRAELLRTKSQLDEASRERSISARVSAEVAKALPKNEPDPTPDTVADPAWDRASANSEAYARGAKIDPDSIPKEVWQAGAAAGVTANDPNKSYEHIVAHVDQLVEDAAAADRVAGRQKSAGGGAPAKSGGNLNDEQLVDDYGIHPEKYEASADKEKVFAAMGRLGY